jgi:nitrogen fixation/metabolism regulation signal transduction histidine kinase
MDKSLKIELTPSEAAKLDDAFRECIAEIKRAREAMKRDQLEIERLKSETRSILAKLRAA